MFLQCVWVHTQHVNKKRILKVITAACQKPHTHSNSVLLSPERDRQTVQAASVKIIYIMYDETRSKPIKSIPFFRRCLHPICIYPHGVHLALPFYQCYAYDEIIMMEPTLPNAAVVAQTPPDLYYKCRCCV